MELFKTIQRVLYLSLLKNWYHVELWICIQLTVALTSRLHIGLKTYRAVGTGETRKGKAVETGVEQNSGGIKNMRPVLLKDSLSQFQGEEKYDF